MSRYKKKLKVRFDIEIDKVLSKEVLRKAIKDNTITIKELLYQYGSNSTDLKELIVSAFILKQLSKESVDGEIPEVVLVRGVK